VCLLFAVANLCLCLMIVFENKFSAIISQCQQSTIATASLRSPLDCGDRSNLSCGEKFCVVVESRWWCLGRLVCKLRDSHCCYATTIANQIAASQTNLDAAILFLIYDLTYGR
jgi:hypothetical protein